MTSPSSVSLFVFSGDTKLVFVQTHKPNGYVTVVDRDYNQRDIHHSYITDLSGNPERQKIVMSKYEYANFS